jgi:hypothetical protein
VRLHEQGAVLSALGQAQELATVSERADRTFDALEVYHLKAELLLAQGEQKDAINGAPSVICRPISYWPR